MYHRFLDEGPILPGGRDGAFATCIGSRQRIMYAVNDKLGIEPCA